MLNRIKSIIKMDLFQKKWRKINRHNDVVACNIFDIDNVTIGKYTYGNLTILNDVPSVKLVIGNFCSIGSDVVFVLGREHHTDTISTFPFKHYFCDQQYEAFSKGDIIIYDDVWIGFRATILSGVHIGQGAIVGAGSVVTQDVPPYAIVGGTPAKIIKYRFSEDIIEELLKIDFTKFDKNSIASNIDLFYEKITNKEQVVSLRKKITNLYPSKTKK